MSEVTVLVVIGKFTLVAFAGTVTVAGTCADATVVLSVTSTDTDAARAKVTVPVKLCPLTTGFVLNVKDDNILSIVKLAVAVVLLYVAVK